MPRGLSTEKKTVSRVNKRSGKISVYTQGYKVGKKQAEKEGFTKANQFTEDIKKYQSIDKRASLQATLMDQKGLIGSKKLSIVKSKIKNDKDVDILIDTYLDKSLKNLNENNKNFSQLTSEHGSILNVVKGEIGSHKILNSINNNKSEMSERAVGSLVTSLNDHSFLESYSGFQKKESYDGDEFRHDIITKYMNPIFQLSSYNDNIMDNIKSYIIDVNGKENNLKYLQNGTKTTDLEKGMFYKLIDILNNFASSHLTSTNLYSMCKTQIHKDVAFAMTKGNKNMNVKLYDSVIYPFKEVVDKNVDLKFLKDVEIENNGNSIDFESCKLYLDENTNETFLISKLKLTDILDYNIISLPSNKMKQVYDEFHNYLMNNLNFSLFSKEETENKLNELYDNLDSFGDDYLILSN